MPTDNVPSSSPIRPWRAIASRTAQVRSLSRRGHRRAHERGARCHQTTSTKVRPTRRTVLSMEILMTLCYRRCPSQPALSVVIEVQLTTRQAPGELLLTRAWTKIPLFDHKKRLSSGRWKVPLRTLPIRQDDDLALINTLAKVHRCVLSTRSYQCHSSSVEQNCTIVSSMPKMPPTNRMHPYRPASASSITILPK